MSDFANLEISTAARCRMAGEWRHCAAPAPLICKYARRAISITSETAAYARRHVAVNGNTRSEAISRIRERRLLGWGGGSISPKTLQVRDFAEPGRRDGGDFVYLVSSADPRLR